jgi:hypothetical protein
VRKESTQTMPFALVFLVIGIFIGISLTTLAPTITITSITNKVCCHSFGFGSQMKRCCDNYEWTTADECKVPEGMVGGGKEIVDNSYCVAATTTTTIDCSTMNPNYCNTDDDCICSLTKCFRGNKDYAKHCVPEVNACQMSYCPFTPQQRMVCIDHTCQIGTI